MALSAQHLLSLLHQKICQLSAQLTDSAPAKTHELIAQIETLIELTSQHELKSLEDSSNTLTVFAKAPGSLFHLHQAMSMALYTTLNQVDLEQPISATFIKQVQQLLIQGVQFVDCVRVQYHLPIPHIPSPAMIRTAMQQWFSEISIQPQAAPSVMHTNR